MRMTWLFGHGNAPRAPALVALLVLLNALLLRVGEPDALVRLRDLAFDSYQRIKPREVPNDLPVRIVDIDEASLEAYDSGRGRAIPCWPVWWTGCASRVRP